ncbi:MAG TPA: hypothetical protein VIN60_08755 [Anaerolineales bacterium]
MPDDVREFLKGEYECAQKTYEVQFNHFMGVFNFWIALITLPSAAGIITLMAKGPTETDAITSPDHFVGLLLAILGVIGMFLSAKMFDIRKAELGYIDDMNHARGALYDQIHDLPETYKPRFLGDQDLQKVACEDFGKWMAIVMSTVNAIYIGGALWYFVPSLFLALPIAVLTLLFGCGTYVDLVIRKVPPKRTLSWWQAYKAILPIKQYQLQVFDFTKSTDTHKDASG